MSLINCPECGKGNVSDSAEYCPNCGYPIAKNMESVITNDNIEEAEETEEALITVCESCCNFDIIEKKSIHRICMMDGGKRIPIMPLKDWLLMSEEEKNQTVDKYVNQIKNSYAFKYSEFNEYHNRIRIDKDVLVYCPKCGNHSRTEYSIRENDTCKYCGTKYKYTQILYYHFKKDVWDEYMNTGKQIPECEYNYLWNNYLQNEMEFSRECMENRENKISYNAQKMNEAYIKAKSGSKTTTNCPRCDSSNIQIVQRKWSLFTGFMTNKVDRVCVNCKHKF